MTSYDSSARRFEVAFQNGDCDEVRLGDLRELLLPLSPRESTSPVVASGEDESSNDGAGELDPDLEDLLEVVNESSPGDSSSQGSNGAVADSLDVGAVVVTSPDEGAAGAAQTADKDLNEANTNPLLALVGRRVVFDNFNSGIFPRPQPGGQTPRCCRRWLALQRRVRSRGWRRLLPGGDQELPRAARRGAPFSAPARRGPVGDN